MKRTIFDTGCVTNSGLVSRLPSTMRYMLNNKHDILHEQDLMGMIRPIRHIVSTPLSDFFDRMVQCDQLQNFAPILLPKSNTVSDILSAVNITFDLKQCPMAKDLQSIPVLANKVVVNVTPAVKVNTHGELAVKTIDMFQEWFVRGQFVAAFHDSVGNWLSPVLTEYMAKSYSMTISGVLAKYYYLDVNAMQKLFGIFALFMCQRLTDSSESLTSPGMFNRCTFAGNRAMLMEIEKECREVAPEGLTLHSLCEIIKGWFGDKMIDFNVGTLLRLVAPFYRDDAVSAQIAIEYPPYWMFMLLRAFSGAKSMLVFELNTHRIMNEGTSKFLTALKNNESLVSLKR